MGVGRGWHKAILATVFLAATASACAKPLAGMDGDLANQWPAMVAPAIWQPTPEACHNQFAVNMSLALYNEFDCTKPHRYQTVHVGQLTGDAASQAQPPTTNSTADKSARADCDPRLTTFLGGQWKDRKVRLRVALPHPDAWNGGARWYSCEAATYLDWSKQAQIIQTSLKGAFDTLAELQFGCYETPQTGKATRKGCDEPHNTEYVGRFNLVDVSYADMKAQLAITLSPLHRQCQKMIDVFVGAPNLSWGTWVWSAIEEDWNAGDRTLHCFFWLDKTEVSKSLKGLGKAARLV